VNIDDFNRLPAERRRALLLDCCHCRQWAERVLEQGAAQSLAQLQQRARRAWQGLRESDYLEAFAAHPRIGDLERLKEKFAGAEQGQVAAADEATLQELQQLNENYLERFGFIFIICASGQSARRMLAALRARIGNNRTEELAIAAAEQAQITRLRLEKYFAQP